MSIYSDKLAHLQVVIICRYSLAQMCTREDTLTHILGALYFDDIMSYNLLTIEQKIVKYSRLSLLFRRNRKTIWIFCL